MIAKHVDALEASLGARLLHSTTRRVLMTDIGLSFYERAQSILAEFELANREAAAR